MRMMERTGEPDPWPRRPGWQTVSLWRTEWDDDDDGEPIGTRRNHRYASFMFNTEPDVMFWNGI